MSTMGLHAMRQVAGRRSSKNKDVMASYWGNGQADKQDERDEKHKGGQPPITEASSLLSASSSASADLVRVHGTSVSAAILTSTKEMPQGEKKPKKCYRVPKATIGLQFQCLLKLRTDKN